MGKLTIFLDKCTNLKDSDGMFNGSDPYVVFDVEKDNWGPLDTKFGKKTSTKKQGEQSPVYGETFEWEGDFPADMKNMRCHIKIMDSGKLVDC